MTYVYSARMSKAVFSLKVQKAVRFAIRTHEGYQKQKRKGKDLPYITHPLLAGLLLARIGASEDVICAGILHDTIEDSMPHKKVTRALIEERFGSVVADLVESVTEQDKSAPWEERKAEALEHIKTFSDDSVLVKSADVVCNLSELVADFEEHGEAAFEIFNASKDRVLVNYRNVMRALVERMPENPFSGDFAGIDIALAQM